MTTKRTFLYYKLVNAQKAESPQEVPADQLDVFLANSARNKPAHTLFGIQLEGSKLCGVVTGSSDRVAWVKEAGVKAADGTYFRIGDDIAGKTTTDETLYALLQFAKQKIAQGNLATV